MERLEKLAVIARVCLELDLQYQIKESKLLAEFIMDLFEKSVSDGVSNLSKFQQLLAENEADFDNDFVGRLFTIFTVIHPLTRQIIQQRDDNVNVNVNAVVDAKALFNEFSNDDNFDPIVDDYAVVADDIFDEEEYTSKDMVNNFEPQSVAHHDREPLLNKVYKGTVDSLKDFGAFVALDGFNTRQSGLVHISAIQSSRVSHPSDVLQKGQRVYVKVVKLENNRISLSMRDVDQSSGMEIRRDNFDRRHATNNDGGGGDDIVSFGNSKKRQRMTSPEMWELKQLVSSGALDQNEHQRILLEHNSNSALSDIDEDAVQGCSSINNNVEVDLEIEVNQDEPQFLKGRHRRQFDVSPVRVVKEPRGSLNRAATIASQYAKDRQEIKRIIKQSNEKSKGPQNFIRTRSKVNQDLMTLPMDVITHSSKDRSVEYGIHSLLSIREQREQLPIFKLKSSLLEAIEQNQVMVVIGETGSGKSTQMTQYLMESGYSSRGVIGCTQPRRVAATSVAKRVASEVGCRIGQTVGYTIRFDDCTSRDTRIKYMTDGMLLREALMDPMLSRYSVIILDEAHERTVSTDVLFGLIKQILRRRQDLKLIVTSATLDAQRFSDFFFHCPIFTIPGRSFPVQIMFAKDQEMDYLDASLNTVMEIHLNEAPGDILVFLTGQEEIDTACEVLTARYKALSGDKKCDQLMILPVYSALPSEMQSKIFEPTPAGTRKCIFATNIAETSVTIDGILYVIDPGFVKQNVYNPKLGMDQLIVVPISQAQAKQRAGRAGRVAPGKCFRLYTEKAFTQEMLPTGLPEIQRTNLADTVLKLKTMGINDLLRFDFMDPPPRPALLNAMDILYSIGALDEEGFITPIGRRMAEFPLEPQLSKTLIASEMFQCTEEILTIIAMLSVQNVFYRPKDKLSEADQKKQKFSQPEGDHLTLLCVYNSWKAAGFQDKWCFDNYIQYKTMQKAQDVRRQLIEIMDRCRIQIQSCGKDFTKVRKAITAGFFRNVAKKHMTEGYKKLTDNTVVFMHPSSSLFQRQPQWVIYHDLVLTTKEYMREVSLVDPKWLIELAPNYYKTLSGHELGRKRKGDKIEPLHKKFEDKDAWRLSSITFSYRNGRGFGSAAHGGFKSRR
ncbi:hypothetical protein MP228_007056 [Amoeboaphelidium protococcarum]|nr:hypothetical protein MP228_007056 [Amoeboaphelidium protococcarum]